jgi:hypothetical protein
MTSNGQSRYDSGDLPSTNVATASVSVARRPAEREPIMRIVSMIGITVGGLLLSSCASTGGNFIGDHLPEWAGGLPADAPPRRGTPGYQDYIRQVDGERSQPANAAPPQTSTPANAPSPKAPQQVDQPVH